MDGDKKVRIGGRRRLGFVERKINKVRKARQWEKVRSALIRTRAQGATRKKKRGSTLPKLTRVASGYIGPWISINCGRLLASLIRGSGKDLIHCNVCPLDCPPNAVPEPPLHSPARC